MADDLSDIGVKVTNPNDLSDIGKLANDKQDWKTQPFDSKSLDLSDIGVKQPAPKSYSVEDGAVHFSVERPWDGLQQAVQDGAIDSDFASKHQQAFQEAQVRYHDVLSAAGNAQVAKAFLHGGGKGAAFLLGSIPGAKLGAAAGVIAVGGPEDPLAAITGPIGAVIGGLTTGTIASFAAQKGIDKAAEYNSTIRSLVASAELHPVADAAGELVAFATSAPKSISNLAKLARTATGAGESGTLAVGKQLAKGAVGGAAFEGIIRPTFDAGRYLVADQLGIKHEEVQGPSLSSLTQNVLLGILLAGHSLRFRDFTGSQVANIVMRGKAREAAGVDLGTDDPAAVIRGFESIGANERADLQKNGLLQPLDAGEIQVYQNINKQMAAMKQSGILDEYQAANLEATQAFVPGFGKNKVPLTSAVVGLKKKGVSNANQEQGSVEEVRGITSGPAEEVPGGGASPLPGSSGKGGAAEAIAQTKVSADPVEVAKEIGFTFNPTSQVGSIKTEGLSPEDKAKLESLPKQWEFTYRGAGPMMGATFYMPEGSTREEILARHEEVKNQWMPPAEAPPVPETPETISAQMKMLVDGKRDAILITKGEKEPPLPEGFKKQKTRVGVFFYNPKVWNGQRIQSYVSNDNVGDILGYGIPAKPAPGTEVGAVVVRDPNGVEKHGVLTDDANLPAVIDAAKKAASPGDTIAIEPEATVIAKRTTGRALRPKIKPAEKPIEEETNDTPTGQTLVGGSGSPAGGVALPAGTPAPESATGTIPQPGSGTDLGTAPEVTGSGSIPAGGGDRRGESSGIPVPGEPGSGPGQPSGTEPALPAAPIPVSLPTRTSPDKPITVDPNAVNHVIAAGDTIAPAGKVTKIKANIEAIMLLNKLEAQNRNATPDEKRLLVQYTGWGGLSQVFDEAKGDKMVSEAYYGRDDNWEKQWGKYYEPLRNLMTSDEWDAAKRSTQYAHYTSRTVIAGMWDAIQQLGFAGGNVLELGAGIGHFFGLAPEAIGAESRFIAVEQDSLSSRILAKIYPQAKVFAKGVQDVGIPSNSVDISVGNVPFSQRIVVDKNYPKLNLHNYFIARALDAVKPGGLVVLISTAHTMDSQAVMRQYLASKGELLGAIRLPNDAFKENAGTEVTTDILVIRKPMTPTPTEGQSWVSTKDTKTHDGKPISINEYFVDHPEMVLGTLSLEGTMQPGREEFAVLPIKGAVLGEQLKAAIARLPANMFERSPAQNIDFASIGAAEGLKDNAMVIRDGALTVAIGGKFVDPITIDPRFKGNAAIEQGIAYVGMRDKYRELLAAQVSPESTEAQLDVIRKDLTKAYDAFVKKYGFLNAKKNDIFEFEQGYYLLMGLEKEHIGKSDTGRPVKTYTKADVFTKRTQFPRVPPESASNIGDAIQISLSYQGRLDVDFVARLIGEDPAKVEQALIDQSLAFRNPDGGLLETPERYLSGNVRKKLARAREMADSDDKFKSNVIALEQVQPVDVPFKQIRTRIGSTWIADSIMAEFAKELFGSQRGGIQYLEVVGRWIVGGFNRTPQVTQTYSTQRFDGEELIGYALNQRSPAVYDTIRDADGTERRVFNEKETTKARVVIEKLQTAFQQWLRTKPDVQVILQQRYNEGFNAFVLPNYEIARLDLPGASEDVILRANQRRAVWRMIQEGHGVLAHSVGSGKTFEMIAIAMESKRLGLAKKPMITVANSTLGQFANAFRKLYPGANILIASKDDLVKEKRKLFLSRIASGDYDAIIIPHSQFDMLEDDPAFERAQVKILLDDLEEAIRIARANSGDTSARGRDPTVKELERQKEKFNDRLHEMADRRIEDVITFQQLGIDLLMVDECFPYETLVTTDRGPIPIGEIVSKKLSVKVLSRSVSGSLEWKPVVKWHKMPLFKKLVTVTHEHGNFTCTEDHKVWTENRGYVRAAHLSKWDRLVYSSLPMVQSQPNGQKQKSFLQPVMLRPLEELSTGIEEESMGMGRQGESSQARHDPRSQVVLYSDDFEQSDVESCNSGKSTCEDARQNIFVPWRERSTYNSTTAIVRGFKSSEREHGTCNRNRFNEGSVSITSKPLQGGHRNSGQDACNRSGRIDPSVEEVEIFRQEENRSAQCSRVVSIKVHKQASDAGFGFRNTPGDCVYDLEVEDNHNFFAEGVLVSNCHLYKKPPFITQLDRVSGLERQTSKRAYSLLMKARWVQSRNGGRGMIGATGTPITNTLGETWHMLNITSPQVLKEYGVDTFDKFVSTFALITMNFDVNATGKLILKNRLATFVNGPELVRMIRSSWDILSQDELRRLLESQDKPELYPRLMGGKVQAVTVEKTQAVSDFNAYLLEIYDQFKQLTGQDKKTYSYIPVLTFLAGKAAALDIRLVRRNAPDDPGSKVNVAVKNVYDIWEKTKGERLTQAVFVDSFNPINMHSLNAFASGQGIEVASDKEADEPADFVPAEDLFLYRDIKRKLMALGIPEREILIINEFDMNKPESAMIFDKVNSGEVRVVMGSTAKMGVGVNIQNKLYALHHLDTPWFPALLEQRNGRIERPGNTNPEVQVMYYGMSGTIDAGLYAKNEAKAKFAHQVLSGITTGREFEDPIGPMISTLQEQMAALSGDPLLVEKVLLEARLRTLVLEQEAFDDDQARKAQSATTIKARVESLGNDLVKDNALLEIVTPLLTGDNFEALIAGRKYSDRKDIIEAMQNIARIHEGKIRKRVADKFYTINRSGRADLTEGGDDILRLGNIKGLDIEAHFEAVNVMENDEKKQMKMVTKVVISGMKATVPLAGENQRLPIGYPSTAEGLMRAIPEVPRLLESQIVGTSKNIEASKRELDEIANLLQRTFPNAEELATAQARYAALQDEVINGTKGLKAAEMLFDMGIDPIPLLIRLRNAVDQTAGSLQQEMNLAGRAQARMGLVQTEEERSVSKKEWEQRSLKVQVLQERLPDLERRLMVVEKARIESELTGESSAMSYGMTPAARPGVSYDNEFSPPTKGDVMQAQGIEAIRQLLNHPLNGLTPDARVVALDLLDQPVMRGLDWSKLNVALVNSIRGDISGTANIPEFLIEISKQASSTTFPHEVFHFLYSMMPEADRIRIDDLRKEELKLKYGEAVDPRLLDGQLTSEQALALGVDPSDYYLINASEYLAHFGSEKFARDHFKSEDDNIVESLWNRVMRWLRGLLDSVKRLLGFKPDMEHIVRDILAGKNVSNIETVKEFEKGPQFSVDEKPEPEPVEDAGVSIIDLESEGAKAISEALNEGQIRTEVLGRLDTIRGRQMLGDAERAAGAAYTARILGEAGLQVEQQPNGLWKLADPAFESEIEGRKLLSILEREIAVQSQPGAVTGYLGNLLNSVVVNMTQDSATAFSPQLRRDLYAVVQGERSHRGLLLGALAGFGKTVDYVARNIDVVLNRVYSDAFGGETVRKVIDQVLTDFRDHFTDDEIDAATRSDPGLVDTVNKVIALNRQDEGGLVYRKAQALLKPKNKKKLGQLEADARVNEAVDQIIANLKEQGVEPIPSPNKPLPAIDRLLMMVQPKTAAKIDAAIAKAIEEAERNAGIKAALDAAVDQDEREDLQGRFDAGEEPTPEQVEVGLKLPQYAHWGILRENLLDYSPTTLKLVLATLRGDYRGMAGKVRPRLGDARIDLRKLAVEPEVEVERVINQYLQNLDMSMELRHATPETKQRILSMVERELAVQVQTIRQRYLDPKFAEPRAKGAVQTPEQQLAALFNAGLLADPRLDVPGMVERVAGRTGLARLVPKVSELVKMALETPFYRQDEIGKNFAAALVQRLGVSPEQAEAAARLFMAAFEKKFAQAKASALKRAAETLTPKERQKLNPRKPTWKKIEEAVNAGFFDSGEALRRIAAVKGWWVPDDTVLQKIKALAGQMNKLKDLSKKELEQIGDNPADIARAQADKDAASLEKRIQIKKQIETYWARMTQPLGFGTPEARRNLMDAIGEFESANLLFKASFAPKQVIDVLTQGGIHTPTRAVGAAIKRWQNDKAAGRDTRLWDEIGSAFKQAYSQRLQATRAALSATAEAFKGTGEARNVDRLMTRIAVFERAAQKADELSAGGKKVESAILRVFEWVRFGYRIAQALDNLHGLPAEYQEMRQKVVTKLRENGMFKAQAEQKSDWVMGDMKAEWMLAIARVQQLSDLNGWNYTAGQTKASAWLVVKSRQYQRMREIGLPADEFAEHNRFMRNTVGWNEREEGGIGGMVAGTIRAIGRGAREVGFPLGLPFIAMSRFGNAIGTMINRKLSFTPMGYFPWMFGNSPWYRTEEDRIQRKVEASIGTPILAIFFLLALTGAVIVRLLPPKDKEERELWEREGHKAGTVEFPLPDGSFIPVSLSTGPLALFAEAFAAGGALHDLNDGQDKKQARLNAEASARGVMPGKVPALGAGDYLGVGWDAFYATVLGGRTASGLVNSITDYGIPNAAKTIASTISPLIPGLPGTQEVTRMAGVRLDPKMATVFDFMLPLPTSKAAQVNMLGDPVGAESDLQRIGQILTGGTFLPVNPADAHNAAAYQTLYASGYRPPSINSGKAFLIDGEYRQMTDKELSEYTRKRGEYFKQELDAVGYTDDPKAAGAAFQSANTRALDEVGAAVSTTPRKKKSVTSLPSAPTGFSTRSTSIRPRRLGSLRQRGLRSSLRGPSLRRRKTPLFKSSAVKRRRRALRYRR